jgi:predicted RNA-binding Zn-ribbon protein involved in translation (DUF1610 family)
VEKENSWPRKVLPVVIFVSILCTIFYPFPFLAILAIAVLLYCPLYVEKGAFARQEFFAQKIASAEAEQQIADYEDEIIHGQDPKGSFIVPSTCEFCSQRIDLQEIKWTGPTSFECPRCGQEIRVQKSD